MARKKRSADTVNAGSTADIAFLLLIFFLVTTTIVSDKGLAVQLPPKPDQPDQVAEVNKRSVFTIVLNGQDDLLVEGERRETMEGVADEVMAFILNNGRDELSSESPQKAVVSFKTDRGTSYQQFIAVYDELKGAYYQIYADRLGLTPEQVRDIASMPPSLWSQYEQLRREIPMRISLAEPTRTSE